MFPQLILVKYAAFTCYLETGPNQQELRIEQGQGKAVDVLAPSPARVELAIVPGKMRNISWGAAGSGLGHAETWMIETVKIDQTDFPGVTVDENVAAR